MALIFKNTFYGSRSVFNFNQEGNFFMRQVDWSRVLAGLTIMAPVPYVVSYADVYMSEDQAAAEFFPGINMQAQNIDLTPEDVRSIQSSSGERVLSPHVRVWMGPDGEAVFIDRVLGKHEFITYALAVTHDGKVKGVEVLQYNETYGYQIRNADWRQQFIGKDSSDKLKVEKDIVNISGATLSCVHVTNGIRRVLKTFDVIKSRTA
jgi:Na+-transporting NADH:ubiquinone oxidoreductase subunit NqrC